MLSQRAKVGVLGQPFKIASSPEPVPFPRPAPRARNGRSGNSCRRDYKRPAGCPVQGGKGLVHLQAFQLTAALGIMVAQELKGFGIIGNRGGQVLPETRFWCPAPAHRCGSISFGHCSFAAYNPPILSEACSSQAAGCNNFVASSGEPPQNPRGICQNEMFRPPGLPASSART